MNTRPSRLSRRTLLGGAAVAVGLPWLASLEPRSTWAQACPATIKRFLAYYWSNGVLHSDWSPAQTGTAWHASPPFSIEPLLAVKDRILVFSGLDNQKLARPSTPPGNHAAGTGCFLTQMTVANNFDNPNRTSLDQVIADHYQGCSKVSSLQLGIDATSTGGSCDGAPCQFSKAISWKGGNPQPNLTDPQQIFDKLFAGSDPGTSAAEAARRAKLRTSVLDYALKQAQGLEPRLAPFDRRKLDQYTTSVRALESEIQRGSSGAGQCAVDAGILQNQAGDFPQRYDLAFSLLSLAFQCDATRVATFMADNAGSGRNYEFIGVNVGHHGVAHHEGSPDKTEPYKKIVRFHMEQLARLLLKLDAIPDANGKSVLENTVVYASSEIADGDRHNHWNMPTIIAGGADHFITGGNHVSLVPTPIPNVGTNEGNQPVANMFVSLLNAMDIPATSFSNSTGPLKEAELRPRS